jgi:hypothetical protein
MCNDVQRRYFGLFLREHTSLLSDTTACCKVSIHHVLVGGRRAGHRLTLSEPRLRSYMFLHTYFTRAL